MTTLSGEMSRLYRNQKSDGNTQPSRETDRQQRGTFSKSVPRLKSGGSAKFCTPQCSRQLTRIVMRRDRTWFPIEHLC